MLNEIHQTLTRLLRGPGQIPPDVDIRYEAPTKQWAESLVRPTINIFLFDIQENKEKRETSVQTYRVSGRAERRMPPRRIDLFYCVSAFATEVTDEHELLWRALATLMKYQEFPDSVVSDELRRIEPSLQTRLGEKEDSGRLAELWNSLAMPPHPALSFILTTPLDLDISIQAPLVLTRVAKYSKTVMQDLYRTAIQIGGVVRGKNGNPLEGFVVRPEQSAEGAKTDLNGQFRLQRVPLGKVRLDVLNEGKLRKQVEVVVPAESYEIVVDD